VTAKNYCTMPNRSRNEDLGWVAATGWARGEEEHRFARSIPNHGSAAAPKRLSWLSFSYFFGATPDSLIIWAKLSLAFRHRWSVERGEVLGHDVAERLGQTPPRFSHVAFP
jgi:hypothetical protein